ncbi:MAG: PAS domain S-box protein [Deltaproteobacteria bacterium]|nr:PAS domain S-box protein [Deltaproteobacteria bacterium]
MAYDQLAFHQLIFDRSPLGKVVCDAEGNAILANEAIGKIVGGSREQILAQNYHELESWRASGLTQAADQAMASGQSTSIKLSLTSSFGRELTGNALFQPLVFEGETYLLCIFDDLSELKKAEDERERLIGQLTKAIEEIKSLRGILPLCSFCKKVRDDQGYWQQVDVYIRDHLLADISHSICPECVKKHYPEL